MVVQPATIPPVPLERPPVPNRYHWAAPEDTLSNTLKLLGLRGAPIDIMGAFDMLRGNLGCGSVRPPPDGPIKIEIGSFPVWELLKELLGHDTTSHRHGTERRLYLRPCLCHKRGGLVLFQ